MAKISKPRIKRPKYNDGALVKYIGITYTVEYSLTGDQGYWYKLIDRLGFIHETELK